MILSLLCGAFLGVSSTAMAHTNTVSSLTINGIVYSLSTNSISTSMIHGQGNKNFEISVHGSGSYGFSVHGYGEDFPTYGIIADTASGGVINDTVLRLHFNDAYLMPDGNHSKVYSGILPIHIYQGSENGFDTNYFRVKVSVTVYPDVSTNTPVKN